MRLAVFAVLALAALPLRAEELTAEGIRDEIVGTLIDWWEEGGWRHGSLYLAPDGRAEIRVTGPEARVDTGRWHLDGQGLCTRWAGLRAGGEKCYALRRAEAGRFVTTGGNIFEIRPPGA